MITDNFGYLTPNFFTYADGRYNPVKEFDFGSNEITINVNSVDREKLLDLLKTNNRNAKETNKMEAKKCDRCGKFYEMPTADENGNGAEVRFKYKYVRNADNMSGKAIIEEQTRNVYMKYNCGDNVDFCPECRKSFKKWFESTDKEEKK